MTTPWRFYVYGLYRPDGSLAYIGKGSRYRAQASAKREKNLKPREILRCRREKDAYAHERRLIAELRPPLNKAPGGNGSRATRVRVVLSKEMRLMQQIGTKAYAARILLAVARVRPDLVDMSKIELFRQIAWPQK